MREVNKMKQYLLFVGDDYYPRGGMHDYKGSFKSAESAKEYVETYHMEFYNDWYHIVDASTMNIVDSYPICDDDDNDDV